MKILYLNNFRGFRDIYIPFYDVNFFVGENSTGKSSVLSLLRLISTPQFWNNDDFNISDIELGFFNELISSGSKSKKEFQIGFHIDDLDERRDKNTNTFLITYNDDHGSPRISEIKVFMHPFNIIISVSKKQLKFSVKEVDYEVKSSEVFKQWIEDIDFKSAPSKPYPREEEFGLSNLFYEIRNGLKKILPKESKQTLSFRPEFLPYSTWIAPIRSKPKRIYESFKLIFSAEGDHTPLLIKSVLANKFKKNITKDAFSKALEKFGKQSGLFDKIEVKKLGKDMSSPFQLNVYLNQIPIKITNVGYGVGQVLPVLAEILVSYKGRWFSIQQPEVHLHPKAQAALGEFLYEASSKKSKRFLIETHSDFIIDRYRYCLKTGEKKPTSQVLFFERKEHGNCVTSIPIDENGQYSEEQPISFREFFINEELNQLTL